MARAVRLIRSGLVQPLCQRVPTRKGLVKTRFTNFCAGAVSAYDQIGVALLKQPDKTATKWAALD